MEIPTISFNKSSFCALSILSLEYKTYHTKCYLQQCNENDMSICLDTGCSISLTFSLDNFEVPLAEDKFGQLKTITTVIPIVFDDVTMFLHSQ